MPGQYSKLIRPVHFTGDIVLINISFFLSYFSIYGDFSGLVANHYFSLLVFYNCLWIIITTALNAYKLYRVHSFIALLNALIKILFFYFISLEIFGMVLTVFVYPHKFLLFSYLLMGVFILLWRITTILSLRIYRKKGFNYRKVVIVGLDIATNELTTFFKIHPEHGYKLYKLFDLQNYPSGFSQLIDDLKVYCKENDIDEIYCSYSLFDIKQIKCIIDFSDQNLIRVKFLPDTLGLTLKQFKVDFYDHIPVFILKPTPLDDTLNKIGKRLFDIVFSILMIVLVFSWLFPFIALYIKLNSKGPAFFKQKRSGLDNADFWCYKFRTMYVNHHADLSQAAKDDPRITKAGAFLRKTSMDELPQFLNVLVGNMSVVGPRPHPLWLNEKYRDIIEKYMVRHFIKPGITGLAQAKGFRGETSDITLMEKRIKMDIFYMENWSFLLDIKIISQTCLNMFSAEENAI